MSRVPKAHRCTKPPRPRRTATRRRAALRRTPPHHATPLHRTPHAASHTPHPKPRRATSRRAAPRRSDGQPDAVHHSLYVWTDRGAWYAYALNPLKGECVLQDEQRLLPAAC